MPLDPVKNFAIVTVSTGYDADDTSVVLTAGHGAKLPAPATDGAFNLVWWNSTDYSNPSDDPNVEIVRCTARSTETLTVTRAQESTTGATHNTGGKTYKMILSPTKKMIDDIALEIPTREIIYDAAAFYTTETNFAPLEKISGGTVKTLVRAFNDTTEEYVNGKFKVPADIKTGSTITFRAYVMAKTAAASKNVGMTFGHAPINNSEDFDPAYTEEDSGDIAIDATQDDVTVMSWTETLANLGWAANDMVEFRLSRDPSVTNDLTGDMYLFMFVVEIPRLL